MQVGGQAAMAGHIRIGEGARVGAQAGVIWDVIAGSGARQSSATEARILKASGCHEGAGAPSVRGEPRSRVACPRDRSLFMFCYTHCSQPGVLMERPTERIDELHSLGIGVK